jgi:hypothetical protein
MLTCPGSAVHKNPPPKGLRGGVPMIDNQHFFVKYLFILPNNVPQLLIEFS